jgi:hypothetical protein
MSTSLSITIIARTSGGPPPHLAAIWPLGRHGPLQEHGALPLRLAVGLRAQVGVEGLTHEL